ncbi:MAG: CBS domain-containing protein, partial [Trebonia sp.]
APDGTLVGVTTRWALTSRIADSADRVTAADMALPCRLSIGTDQTLRQVAYLFAETGLTSAPVTDSATGEVVGVITLPDLLQARLYDLTEEHHRQRLLPRPLIPAPTAPPATPTGQPVAAVIRGTDDAPIDPPPVPS